MAERVARRARVTGRVQGVSYRAWTRAEARRLGVSGEARNEPDGSVTVHAEGEAATVEALLRALSHGPPAARVDNVKTAPAEATGAVDFTIG
jgi:Acylphosphatases